MTLYFILFLQLVTLLTGASILSPQKIAIKDFIIWLLIITIIGLPLYNVIGFFAIFVVILFLIISLSLKTKQVFTNILSVCVPLIIIVVTDYFSQIMEMYVLKKVLNSFIVHYDRLLTVELLASMLSIFPLIIIVVTDYFSQIMEMYVLKKVLNSFIVHYDRLLTVELLASMLSILICCFIKSLIGKFRQFLTLDRKYQSLILSFLLLTLVIFELLASMLSILICCFIKSLIGKFRQFLTLDRKYQSLILSFLLLTLVIFYFNIFLGQIQGFSPKHLILTGLLFFIYAVLLGLVVMTLIYILNKDAKMKQERILNQQLHEYTLQIEQLYLFFIYAVLLGLVVMTLIYILNKDAKMKQERILNQQLHEYTLQIEQLYTNLNSFRHDYLNILLSLEEGIRQENIEIIKDVYQSIIQPTKQLVKGNDYILGQLHKIQVVEIKSLLTAKIIKSQNSGIEVRLEIEDPINSIYMDTFSFYRVFSILLDNAIEGASTTNHPYISIIMIQDRDAQQIQIENNCEDRKIDLQTIYTKGYSSKGKDRGIGLYNVHQLLEENKYIRLETSYESGVFIQTLILQNEER